MFLRAKELRRIGIPCDKFRLSAVTTTVKATGLLNYRIIEK